MSRKLNTRISTSVRVKQRTTLVKYVVAGSLIFSLIGASIFVYLNLAGSEEAEARSHSKENLPQPEMNNANASFVDLSRLSNDEMELLQNRDFVRDTTKKEYSSVKWDLNKSLSHLTLEVSNTKYEYSLELFDKNGARVLYFTNLSDEKVFVDKLELHPNHEYNYLVRNSIGEMYAGNLMFN